MKRTGAIIVGQFATSFFTGEAPTNTYCNSLDLALPNTGPCECWFSLLKGDIVASGNGCSSIFKDAKVSHLSSLKKAYYQRDHPVKIQEYVRTQNLRDGSQLLFQILPAPCRITDTRPTDGSLAFAWPHKHCSPETCWYDDAWGPNDCNFISWKTAVCRYPHLASNYEPMTWIEEPYIWDHEATGVCSDLAPTRRWTVALPPPRDCEGRDGKDSDEAEVPNDMAETAFVHYLRNIFETLDEWNDEHDADHMNAEGFYDEYYDRSYG